MKKIIQLNEEDIRQAIEFYVLHHYGSVINSYIKAEHSPADGPHGERTYVSAEVELVIQGTTNERNQPSQQETRKKG